jgi:hypothetical protein
MRTAGLQMEMYFVMIRTTSFHKIRQTPKISLVIGNLRTHSAIKSKTVNIRQTHQILLSKFKVETCCLNLGNKI